MQQKSCFQTRLEIEIAIKEEDEKKFSTFGKKLRENGSALILDQIAKDVVGEIYLMHPDENSTFVVSFFSNSIVLHLVLPHNSFICHFFMTFFVHQYLFTYTSLRIMFSAALR